MPDQDSFESSSPAVDGDITSHISKHHQPQSLAMKCADNLPNLSSNNVNCGLISPLSDAPAEAQAGTLPSPQASAACDLHITSECCQNKGSGAHESPRSASTFHRGGSSHRYNNSAECSSKRSNRAAFNQLSGNVNRHASSSSQHTSSAGFGSSHHGIRLNRDSGGSESRVVARRVSRSVTTDDVHGGLNHATVDGKFVRILQRPLQLSTRFVGRESGADNGEDEESSLETLQQQQQLLKRASHRKKTLSLNPEEREALENLVEEVIIGGLGEAIIDSDGTSSDDNDDENNDFNSVTHTDMNHERLVRTDVERHRGRVFELNKDDKIVYPKTVRKDIVNCSDLNYSLKGEGKIPSRNNGNHRVQESSITGAGIKGKDVKRGELNRQNKDGSPEGEKEKPNAATVRGVNIYPAQLKVAIKHMDSLPPRFLRRLQTGSNRTSGNESIIARLTMKSPTPAQVVADDASCSSSPTDRDRGRSKQTQLQETKKTIRNLLCDLDQYTDETVMMKDDCSHHEISAQNSGVTNLAFGAALGAGYTDVVNNLLATQMARPHQSFFVGQQALNLQLQLDNPSQGIFDVQLPPIPQMYGKTLQRFKGQSQMPHMISCEELERELLQGSSKDMSMAHALVEVNQSKTSCAQLPNKLYQHPVPQADGSFLSYDLQHQKSIGSSEVHAAPVIQTKSQFSVDAPEFVSSFFVMNRQMTQGVTGMQSNDQFYPANTADMSVQVAENIHLPMKSPVQQYPMVMVSSAGLALPSSSGATEYVEMSTCNNAVASAPYQMISYDQMDSPSLPMVRNASSYMVPMSLSLAPPSATCSTEVVSPSVIDMNVLPYPQYQYMPGNSGYGSGYLPPLPDFQKSPADYDQPPSFVSASMCNVSEIPQQWNTESSVSQQQWYNGYSSLPFENSTTYSSPSHSSFDEIRYGSSLVMSGYQAQQMRNQLTDANAWTYENVPPYEMSHRKVLQLLSKGANVMVICIGEDGNKSTFMSQFPSNGTRPVMLHVRNSPNSSNQCERNIKQVMDALESKMNPVLVDHTDAQSWDMERYSKLAEIHGYHVEIIDSTAMCGQNSVDCRFPQCPQLQ